MGIDMGINQTITEVTDVGQYFLKLQVDIVPV